MPTKLTKAFESCPIAGKFGCQVNSSTLPSEVHVLVILYLLSPWCRVLLEKLTGLQLVKKFPAFHGTRRFITALTSFRQLSLSWDSPIQSIYQHPTSWRSILILPTHLRLGLPSGLLPLRFPPTPPKDPIPRPTHYLITYLLTYLLTAWCRVLLEKLTGLQLVKKFPAFHGTRRFITALTSVRQLSLSWDSPIQSIYPRTTYSKNI